MTTKRERQKANRAQRRERERREAKRRRQLQLLRRGAIIAAIVIGGGILFSVLFQDDDEPAPATTSTVAATSTTAGTTDTTTPPTTAPLATAPPTPVGLEGFRSQPTACGGDLPPPPTEVTFDAPEDMGIAADATATATLATSCGEIVINLNTAEAPETVNSFAFLAGQGYFDGTASHRIVPGFVVQAGDPTATGTGGPGYVIADEFPDEGFVYERGVVAMANAGPGTTGSQFFIVASDAALPPQFSVLGEVVSGMDVVDMLTAVPLALSRQGEQSVPLESVYLEQVTVAVS